MNKKLLTIILTGVGLVLMLFSLILLCVSAGLVGDIEDVIGLAGAGELGYNLDIDLNADIVRAAADLIDDLPTSLIGTDMDVTDMLEMMGIDGAGFKLFALNARGWFFWIGLICVAAGVVMTAISANAKLGAMALDVIKAFGAAVVSGARSLISGINFTMPKRAPRAAYGCPKCGAPFTPGTPFCGTCGTRLPDAAAMGVCKHCGTRNEPGSRFCSGCGQPME